MGSRREGGSQVQDLGGKDIILVRLTLGNKVTFILFFHLKKWGS